MNTSTNTTKNLLSILVVIGIGLITSQSQPCHAFQSLSLMKLQLPHHQTLHIRNNRYNNDHTRNHQHHHYQHHYQQQSITKMFNSKGGSGSETNTKTKTKATGVYSRPSAAIEKGSGFFVPGLEGSKVRILFGALVLLLNVINHSFISNSANLNEISGYELSEKIATFYGIFLLFQGIIEFGKEVGLGFDGVESNMSMSIGDDSTSSGSSSSSNSSSNSSSSSSIQGENSTSGRGSLEQFISPSLTERSTDMAEAASWTAASYVSLTPTTHVMVLEQSGETSKILYRLGEFSNLKTLSDTDIESSIAAAVETVYQSKGGRVSIPIDHPAANLLPEDNRRCVLLQQVYQDEDVKGATRRISLLIGSDQLLATFTKNDLKWLGSLGEYLSNKLVA